MEQTDIDPLAVFRYRSSPLVRRHGPSGYSDYGSFRPWLRDEFAFRCVYCLIRERWGRVTGEFDLDHFVPQQRVPTGTLEYDNLLYACRPCNLRKSGGELPDPAQSLISGAVHVRADGTLVSSTPEAAKIIRLLCLNSPQWRRWRRMWIRIIDLALRHDPELLADLLGFPDDLPDLGACRAPDNKLPDGVRDSFFARRRRGELPALNLAD